MEILSYAILIVAILFGVIGQLMLKYGMSQQPGFRLADLALLIKNIPVVLGFMSYGISTLLYFKAVASLDLSLAYPTVSLGYVLVVLLSKRFFQENVNRTRWIAVTIICFGVALVGLGSQ